MDLLFSANKTSRLRMSGATRQRVHVEAVTVSLPNICHPQPSFCTHNYQKDARGVNTSTWVALMATVNHGTTSKWIHGTWSVHKRSLLSSMSPMISSPPLIPVQSPSSSPRPQHCLRRHQSLINSSLVLSGTALSNRHQFISINYYTSSTALVTHGVPQGSVPVPLLFTI